MSGHIDKKLNYLMTHKPRNVVFTTNWLEGKGYYRQLVYKYCKGGWLKKVGHGAYIRLDDDIHWEGAVYSLQKHMELPIHVGGLTALDLHGYSHNVVLNKEQHASAVVLMNNNKEKFPLPKWFGNLFPNYFYMQRKLFTLQDGIDTKSSSGIELQVSSPERAILEVLGMIPRKFSYEHASYIIEGLHLLRPLLTQKLLENCNSVKVKRLFLYLSETHGLPCFSDLNISRIDIGTGKMVIGEGGMYIPKYLISVPKLKEEDLGIAHV